MNMYSHMSIHTYVFVFVFMHVCIVYPYNNVYVHVYLIVCLHLFTYHIHIYIYNKIPPSSLSRPAACSGTSSWWRTNWLSSWRTPWTSTTTRSTLGPWLLKQSSSVLLSFSLIQHCHSLFFCVSCLDLD